MEGKLSYNQVVELRNRMRNDTFDKEYEIKTLIRLGYHPDIAAMLITNVVLGFKDELAEEIEEAKKVHGRREFTWIIVLASSVFITNLGNNGLVCILLSLVIAILAGYFGFPEKRIPAIAGFVTGTFLMVIFNSYPIKKEEHYSNILLLIELAISYGFGLLVKYILSRLMYSNKKQSRFGVSKRSKFTVIK
ncbi:hypothetical protein EV144_107269 [Flavobacterium sp. 270]|uniref:hypothetical protein n=1 Tax=Flavobacterium sp. 270 TaxID=2512114 RepID=UPI0010652DE9|nr:hypothetical protein [Flavobacterium sp. 270]TDW46075.1 hypothetical protein EV144_107269 [Flavobacterium sp. 270]